MKQIEFSYVSVSKGIIDFQNKEGELKNIKILVKFCFMVEIKDGFTIIDE